MARKIKNNKIGLFQIFILILCVYVIASMFCSVFINFTEETKKLLQTIDTIICIIFLFDFFKTLYQSENKLLYLKWGWIDFASSLPMVGFLRWGRALRIFRILKVLRGIRSAKTILQVIFKNKVKGTFSSIIIISVMVLICSSISILQVETLDNSNIKTAEDALWWSFVTITTVGYGDFYPVSFIGRIISCVLMIVGIGLFGSFAAYISTLFFEDNSKKEESILEKKYNILVKEIREIKEILKNERS